MAEVQTNSADSLVTGKRGISGYWLKMIAVITMLIDHTAASILERILMQMPVWGSVTNQNYEDWYTFYMVLRTIGRMAFPIYCFLLVEGFYHTRSKGKYAFRLFLFALISEVPFDLVFQQSYFDMSYNNVFLTLLIGFLTIWAASVIIECTGDEHSAGEKAKWMIVLRGILLVAALTVGSLLAELLHTDYGACGVLAIFTMYMLYQQRMLGFAVMVLELGLLCGTIEWSAFLMLIPMHFYNGTRGRQIKYLFYAFYPAHLLILALICWALGLGI